MKYNNIYRLGVKILTLRFKIINNYMNKQQIEEQDTFFEFFDTWTEPLPVPEKYCLDNDVEDFIIDKIKEALIEHNGCLLYTSPSPRDRTRSRMPSSA